MDIDISACVFKALEFFAISNSGLDHRPSHSMMVSWKKADAGWVKLNMDGSFLGNLGASGFGGLIYDQNGTWICGYARKVGNATSVVAELWGLKAGLSIVVSMGFPKCCRGVRCVLRYKFSGLNFISPLTKIPTLAHTLF